MSQNLVGVCVAAAVVQLFLQQHRPAVIDLPWNLHANSSVSISHFAMYHTDNGEQAVSKNSGAGRCQKKATITTL